MNNVIHLPPRADGGVTHVSVQVSEYSEENGGAEAGTGTMYAVETLFTDGTWSNDGYYRDLGEANRMARRVAKARSANLLRESLWPNRKVKGGAA